MTTATEPFRWPVGARVRATWHPPGRVWIVESVSEDGRSVALRPEAEAGGTTRLYCAWNDLVEVPKGAPEGCTCFDRYEIGSGFPLCPACRAAGVPA